MADKTERRTNEIMEKYDLKRLSDSDIAKSVREVVSELVESGFSNPERIDTVNEVTLKKAQVQYSRTIAEQNFILIRQLDKLTRLLGKDEWIPCSERLPEEVKGRYWVCTDGGSLHECRWTNVNPFWTDMTTDWHWNTFDIPQYSKVVAWMPLPEQYKGDNDYERSVEQMEHDMLYEPTYSSEDGSM